MNTTAKVYIGLALFCLVILFIISPDSYTHDSYNRVDSAWFFMCGKAWMNGMIPYIDFADSKGPLLWFIYGIGYLLSPLNYHGVFWISVLWYSIIYIVTFKTALLFLPSSRKALICTLIMTLSFFNPWFHQEIRAEDFCLLFLVTSLYIVCKTIYKNDGHQNLNTSFFILGSCFAILLLIKFNIAAMQAIYVLYLYYYNCRTKHSPYLPLFWGCVGIAAIAIPFLVYFLISGNFSAFIQEYFLNTLQTTTSGSAFHEYLSEWLTVINTPSQLTLLAVIVIGSLYMRCLLNHDKYFPLISSIFVFSLTIRHALWPYYFNSCSYLAIWLICYMLYKTEIVYNTRIIIIIAFAILLFSSVSNLFNKSYFRPVFFRHYPEKEIFYEVSKVMSQVKNPTLINACCWEYGYGIMAHSLPGGKYWTLQNGATEDMIQQHRQEILSGKSNFLFVYSPEFLKLANLNMQSLLAAGYRICNEWGNSDDKHYLLTNLKINHINDP